MTSRSYTFSHAVVRKPSASIVDGLRAVDTGVPDLERFRQDHAHYVSLLASTGAAVSVLEPLDDYPDSVFVEDAALCLPELAIAMRPGTPSRVGEAAVMAPVLSEFYSEVVAIDGPGFIDGGDVLVTEREILVGRSARTDAAGIAELAQITSPWGYTVREVETPAGVLHFKTDCSLMDEETVLATSRLSDTGCFDGYKVINTADGEDAAANAIRFNGLVLMPAGFPKTAARLSAAGYDVREVGNSEAAKLDGGMSCLSLRFSPPA
ncbi:dimethylarginine dimethylaminohydrolase [Anderseniella sp. Alg231-50]|uniref:dimethylarginine dimethylaminohydrolase n=1 Tax=Anderseniella sp. Alg231-50 TaxID=1922226 RepID=UPI000D558050